MIIQFPLFCSCSEEPMHNASFPVRSSLHLSFISALECSFTERLVPRDAVSTGVQMKNVFLKWLFECRCTLFFTVKFSVSIVQGLVKYKTRSFFELQIQLALCWSSDWEEKNHIPLLSHWYLIKLIMESQSSTYFFSPLLNSCSAIHLLRTALGAHCFDFASNRFYAYLFPASFSLEICKEC